MVNQNLEEGVHEEDAVRQDTAAVQQHGLQQQETKPVIGLSLSIRCFDKHLSWNFPPSVRYVRGKTVSDIKPSIKSRLENACQFELLVVSSPWCCLTHSVLLKNKHYRPSDHYVEFKQPIYTTIASLLACFLPHNNCVKMNATFRLLAQTGEPLIFDVAGGIMYVVICVAGRESVGKGGLRVK